MLPQISTLDDFRAQLGAAPAADASATQGAEARNGQLTKPPGALGRLEDLAIWYAGWRGSDRPAITAPQVIVFAGNHGVTAQGVSAFPAEVTAQMVLNFEHGGAAINQLAEFAGARMDVHALDLDRPTQDFTKAPAMSEAELLSALQAGWEAVDPTADLLVVGEMGIGNTTAAAALSCALFGGAAAEWTGRGTGVDDAGLANKSRVVAEGVALHGPQIKDGLDALACLGGREIAAMAGAIAAARMLRIPVILDGYICCSAAACLLKTHEGALDHAVAGHKGAEAAHVMLLDKLGKEPLLTLGLRLGEGSGAALAIQILKGAIACHSGMATFAEAGVTDG
ncbi:nicotinate-nucleotide--dimethylbenzimidazole phosphoribosyltransferase [Phaeobacter gallaeciensis]|uniref:nicotinate-nucleotide--dimethylbenzimidazole phosphoribosyltransferase n=1 Tax=Phaeobacter gallaeciensis TaxID=60890 RepID=UPI00237FBE9C|nr:nicotinate-nucleotide--dimethylbenzimidazole phosphoribosyltransferase [Phaeobacter gallaeciensis]MDE4191652.1 nicotinate-nucleotide--dimethylbenzimidazole phosphoribosyltransferase [Phaeobacter gallaeciensis]MDE4200115.1 nicotinate-nucleotide--dimethylbenzimidazole phosphoribosyltransferase [Phaeobacter gallaeciensis]MDE4204437.1 nicotinate-nucleotide--dimethylbenzimidazole phosphoribosyltransferase [Phaeobacter gallaeciensis]MDE4208407.1 nicotinate-nucleotide--dimethylbenzimidazole phospho